ncbi:MAG TPA: VWA domain-containing protein [Bryobacteraceae bacterium]|nr:VWA domain-containing protein [Bryobacteraceae bacterium]
MRSYFRSFVCLSAAGAILAAGLLSAPAQDPPKPDQAANQDQTIRVDVDLVNILFNVRAKKGGQLISTLEKNNFIITEDGKPQTVQRFTREADLPLTLGLLIDISGSQERLIETERQAAAQFFSTVIRKKDEAFLISFGKNTELLQDYTNSPRQLSAALDDLRGDGQTPMMGRSPVPVNSGPIPQMGTPKGTLLYDAIYLASHEKLKNEVGRKAMILITDGGDQGSTYTLRQAVEAAQRSDAIIYSIYYVDHSAYGGGRGFVMGGGDEGGLKKMSEETGGHVFSVSNKHPLTEIFQQIQDELRNQYSIGYSSTNANRDGSFRRIEIKTDSADYKVQARNGYYATPNDAR